MIENFLTIEAIWADEDLIKLRVEVRFQGWGGAAEAYVTRGEMLSFATELDTVFKAGTEARFEAGQRDMGYADLALREYSRVRRLAMDAIIGDGPETGRNKLRTSVPIERGSLERLARGFRRIAMTDSGEVTISLPPGWP